MYWTLFIVIALASWAVSALLDNRFKQYSQVGLRLTGREVAEKMLHDNGIEINKNNIVFKIAPMITYHIEILEKIRPLILDIATTIIIIGDTIPALTAASPNIKPPRIEIEDPILLGILKSVSRSISKQVSNIIHSTKLGKGTLSL